MFSLMPQYFGSRLKTIRTLKEWTTSIALYTTQLGIPVSRRSSGAFPLTSTISMTITERLLLSTYFLVLFPAVYRFIMPSFRAYGRCEPRQSSTSYAAYIT